MKKAVMYGAGNFGRGYLGQLFCESGYETVFIDVNPVIINKINADGGYPVYVAKNSEYSECRVDNICGIDGKDTDSIAEAVASADIAATAVGVNALRYIAEPFAAGIKLMFENHRKKPLNVLICENLSEADKYFSAMIKSHLSEEVGEYFDSHVGLVLTAVGRLVPETPKAILEQNPLAVCVEEYRELPVDKNAFKGTIPNIKHMIPCEPFGYYLSRKLYMNNMGHVMCAYLGYLRGYKYIWETLEDESVRTITRGALREVALALSKEYKTGVGELYEAADLLLERFSNKLLGDTVERVGRDTKRKLAENDRFVGAAMLCQKHGVTPYCVCAGIAAGLMFDPEGDVYSTEVAERIKKFGLMPTLAQYCGIDAASELALAIRLIYEKLSSGSSICDVAEMLKKR